MPLDGFVFSRLNSLWQGCIFGHFQKTELLEWGRTFSRFCRGKRGWRAGGTYPAKLDPINPSEPWRFSPLGYNPSAYVHWFSEECLTVPCKVQRSVKEEWMKPQTLRNTAERFQSRTSGLGTSCNESRNDTPVAKKWQNITNPNRKGEAHLFFEYRSDLHMQCKTETKQKQEARKINNWKKDGSQTTINQCCLFYLITEKETL